MHDEKAIKAAVRQRYGELAERAGPCCGSGENRGGTDRRCAPGYSPEDLAALDPAVVSMGLGCGNPAALAELGPGDVVLDLGSGGGIDVFLAARRVGPSGRAIGVDMTEEMFERARRAAAAMGIANADFRHGDIDALPLEDRSVDVVISNCVINLAPDKLRVFREAFRVLRPGGRLVVSDVVSNGPLPASVRADLEAWARCLGGALEEGEYLDLIEAAGFEGVEILSRQGAAQPGEVCNITVRARKPVAPAQDCGTSRRRPVMDPLDTKTEELIAIGAALAANCEPCLRYHVRRGGEAGCTREAMRRAVEIAQGVKATPARLLARLADRLLGSSLGPQGGDSPCEAAGGPTVAMSAGPCCSPPVPPEEDSPRDSVDHR